MQVDGGAPGDVRKQESSHAYEKAPIAAMFEDCLQYFERIDMIQDPEMAGFPNLDGYFSRFRQWGSDTGAQTRALDHTLRKASQLQQATKDLLRDLLTALQNSKIHAFPRHGMVFWCFLHVEIRNSMATLVSISPTHGVSCTHAYILSTGPTKLCYGLQF